MENLIKKFKKQGTASLLAKVEKLTGVEKSACVEVLSQRGTDVTKWMTIIEGGITLGKAPIKAPEVVFEDETPLTVAEMILLNKAEESYLSEHKDEVFLEPDVKVSLKEKAELHIHNFKRGSQGLAKVVLITRGRKITKLSDSELKLIISIPLDLEGDSKPKVETPKVSTPATELKETLAKLSFPEGFSKGDSVTFLASKTSKTPGAELTGKIKRYFFDKQDQKFYFTIDVNGKEMCKRPDAVTKI